MTRIERNVGYAKVSDYLVKGYALNKEKLQSQIEKSEGTKRIADNALVVLTLMIAMSDPREKDIITKIIINLINRNN